jgi:hypothetical protein
VADHGHVAEGGAPDTGTVQGRRELAEDARQVDAIGGRLHGHPTASQPGHRGPAALGLRAVVGVKAIQATDQLCFEAIDRPVEVDHVVAQFMCRESVDRLTDECIDSLIQTLPHIGDGERFHAHILPNLCSPSYGHSTDKRASPLVYATYGNNI